jgi:hypothetical protein
MARYMLATTSDPFVIIEALGGNLDLKGWDADEVLLKGPESGNPLLEGDQQSVRIRCDGDALVRVPHNARLRVQTVQGGARIKMLEAPLSIETVHGSLELRDVAQAQVGRVHGNLLARQVAGGLQVATVNGNLVGRDIQGASVLSQINGNAELRDAEGTIELNVNGNARLRLSLLEGERCQVSASGNLYCCIPEDASVHATLRSGGENILVHLPQQRQNLRQAEYTLTLGAGELDMRLSAGGSLALSSQEAGWSDDEIQDELEEALAGFRGDFAQQFTEQIESQLKSRMDMLNQRMDKLGAALGRAGVPSDQAERIIRQARAASQNANERSQEKMRRVQEKLERKLGAAQQKAEARSRSEDRRVPDMRRRSWSFEWGSPKPQPSMQSVSDEERLLILRMLEEKKITIEQAEQLLAALENSAE